MVRRFLTAHQRYELKQQLAATQESEVYRRTLALLAIDQGYPKASIAQLLQIGRRTLYHWLDRYQANPAPIALHHHSGQGRSSLWTKKHIVILRSLLRQSPQTLGYSAALWTIPILREQLNRQAGLSVSEKTLRQKLHDLGYVWKRFRHRLEADPDQEKKKPNSSANSGLIASKCASG